ncbi:MAG TPA: hypothetical protein GXZ90_06255 [Clostridiales bacterium]|nr:hypothetical protein [Clostridiales bacterium]
MITFIISDADESTTALIGYGFVGLLSMFLMRSIYYFGKSIQNKMFKIKGKYDKKNIKF